MRKIWFRRAGWVYRPISAVGWVLTLITAALTVQVFVAVERHSHSASDTLIGIFPYVGLFLVILGWIAHHTSTKD